MLSAALWGGYIAWAGLRKYWRELDQHSELQPLAARKDLALRLQGQVRYFAKLQDAPQEWKELARLDDPLQVFEQWCRLPILTRQDLKHKFSPQRIQSEFGVEGVISSTGGSTGEPTPFLHDRKMLSASAATRIWCRQQLGWHPGMATIAVWGSERDVGRASSLRNRISGQLRREYLVGGYSLTDRTVDSVVELVLNHRPVALYGFTSMLEYIAERILARGIEIPEGSVVAAWNGGEMLYPRQAELFELAFHCSLRNLYGSRELSAMAFEPAAGGKLIPLRPFQFLEIVDEQGRPTGPGEVGRLIWTSTICGGSPLLRYDCGDLGSFGHGDSDASGIRRLADIHGRSAGFIQINGRTLNGLFWNHLFKDYPEVEQFQVSVKGTSALHLRLKGTGFTEQREQNLRQLVGAMTGYAALGVEWVREFPRTRQGKLEQVLRES